MLSRSKIIRTGSLILIALGWAGACTAQSESEIAVARDAIWAKELAIYKARGEGNLDVYLNSASERYKGWPPGVKVPGDLRYLRGAANTMRGHNQERLTMELADFTLSGDTAVIYYHTHRTVMPKGEPTDQRYAICHVWTREQGEWKLVGALGRLKSESELR